MSLTYSSPSSYIVCIPVSRRRNLVNKYMLIVNNINTTKMCEICSKLTIIDTIMMSVVFLLFTLNRKIFPGKIPRPRK